MSGTNFNGGHRDSFAPNLLNRPFREYARHRTNRSQS